VRPRLTLGASFDRAARLMGFGIDEVHVSGHGFTQDADIYDALDLDHVRTYFGLDTPAIRSRLERLPWVATAELVRAYPGRLEVHIAERKPFAVWRLGEEERLIDRSGRLLARISPGSVTGLPRTSGAGANTELPALLALIDRHPAVKSRLEMAERVADRRWSLHLTGHVVLHLPASREAPALAEASAGPGFEAALATAGSVIDLRAPGRVAVRNEAPGTSSISRVKEQPK
jgi:cell division protein FtsQ